MKKLLTLFFSVFICMFIFTGACANERGSPELTETKTEITLSDFVDSQIADSQNQDIIYTSLTSQPDNSAEQPLKISDMSAHTMILLLPRLSVENITIYEPIPISYLHSTYRNGSINHPKLE